jgi:hypothetical protein
MRRKTSTMSGITTTGIQAPIVNFETTTTMSTTVVAKQPMALMTRPRFHLVFTELEVVLDHAELAEREAGEHAHGVERDQGD